MIERTFKSWMRSLCGLHVLHVTVAYAIELAVKEADESEVIRLTKMLDRGITFLDITAALVPTGPSIRGDRRKGLRIKEDRRSRVRTPGRFKNAEDAAYTAIRNRENN